MRDVITEVVGKFIERGDLERRKSTPTTSIKRSTHHDNRCNRTHAEIVSLRNPQQPIKTCDTFR